MFRIVVALALLLLGVPAGDARLLHGSGAGTPSFFTPAWQSLKVGSGGLLNSIHISPSDGTMIVATNTYGAYYFRSTGTCSGEGAGGWGTSYAAPCWEQLITTNSVMTTLALGNSNNTSVIEAVSCNNNTNDAYMLFNGNLWVTTALKSSARTWTKVTGVTTSINGNQGVGTGTGRAIACDPANPNIVYVGVPTGLMTSQTGLSASGFSTVSGVGTTGVIPSLIAFDPTSSTGTCGSIACSLHFWVFTAGTGVYETYNGGTSFTKTTSGPVTPNNPQGSVYGAHMVADGYGQLFVVLGTTTVYKYTSNGSAGGGTWTTGTAGGNGVYNIAVDPTTCCSTKSTNRIIVTYLDGATQISNDNGGTFNTSAFNIAVSSTAPQAPWMGVAFQSSPMFLDAQDMVFDNSGNLFLAAGIGVWQAAPTIGTNPVSYVANSVGIEQLVVNQIISAPGLGPSISHWDRAFFGNLNPDIFPTNFWTGSLVGATQNGVEAGWGLDYASATPTFLTGWAGTNGAFGASSSDGGATWTIWPSFPGTFNIGGAIAALSTTDWILVPGTGTLYYTLNAGTTWTPSTISGNFGWFNGAGFRIPLAADRVAASTYCAVDLGSGSSGSQQFYTSTNNGVNFAKVNVQNVDGIPFNDQLRSVPGQSGNYFYSGGNSGGGTTTYHLWKSTDTCVHWTDVNTNLTNIYGFGFGAPKPGGSGYPVIYAFAALSGVQGIYESDDAGTTWDLVNVPTSAQTWPNNSADFLKILTGDINVYGRIYCGESGSGSCYTDKQDACPWVNFSNTNPNASLTGTVTLTAKGSGLVPVTGVNFYVDGSQIGSTQTGAGPYSVSWITGGVATGAHTLEVSAIGNGCNSYAQPYNSFSIPITTH